MKVVMGFLHGGDYKAVFAESKQALVMHDLFSKKPHLNHEHGQMGKLCGTGGVPDGRNAFAAATLEHGLDWLFMVDTDMGFAPDTLDRLLAAAHPDRYPVVGALAFAHKTDGMTSFGAVQYRPTPTVYRFHEDDASIGFAPWFDYPRNQRVKVAATGAACILIHQSVFAKIVDKYGPIWFDPIRHPKGAHFSEDMSFCIRAAGVDVPLYVHTGIKTDHDKGGVVWNEQSYDRSRPPVVEAVAS